MGDRTNPTQTLSSVFDELLRGFVLRQQPHDLPVASRNRIFSFVGVVLDLFEAKVRFDRQTFLHHISIHQEMVSKHP